MEARFLRGLSAAVVGVLTVAFIAGIVLPVYSDEIGWRFQERAGFDGVDKLFSEACGPNTLAAPPWFMMPMRWYSAIFNAAFADPFWIRVSGILYALVWVGMVLALIRRLTADREARAIVTIIATGLVALGTMPLLMIWSRPEQPVMLAALGALLIAFADGTDRPLPDSASRKAWVRSLGIWALNGIAIGYHLKGLFLLPLMLACLLFASRGTKALIPRLTAAALILGTTAHATLYWRNRLACPDDPVLEKAYNGNNISGLLADVSTIDQARDVFGKLIDNMSIFQYITDVGPRVYPLSYWLETKQVTDETSFHWFVALALAWGLALAVAMVAAAAALLRGLRERRLEPTAVLSFIAVGIVIAWSSMQPIRNVYESKFVIPLLALAIIFGLCTRLPDWARPGLRVIATGIGLFALVSPIAVGLTYAPSLQRAAGQQGYIAAQPYSVSVFGFSKVRPQIEAAARLCKIDLVKSRAVLVDDLTYFPLMRSHLPQHKLGVVHGWNGSIKDPIAYLKSRGSDGAVLGCRDLDEGMRRRAKRVGDVCCLSARDW